MRLFDRTSATTSVSITRAWAGSKATQSVSAHGARP